MSGEPTRKKRSPYQRYRKSPYRYSPAYQRWKNAIVSGRDAEAHAADIEWRNMFAPREARRSRIDWFREAA